jgi:2-oxoisovalerate dehydrogenase E1 component
MLGTALEDPDPVLIFENVMLYNRTGELAANAGPVDIDRAASAARAGTCSLITYGGSLCSRRWMRPRSCRKTAYRREVIDLRSCAHSIWTR